MKIQWFRVARAAATAQHVAATAFQIAAFWSTFLWILPAAVQRLGTMVGEPSFALPWLAWFGPLLFALASGLGLASAFWMCTRGHGTPLPMATARDFVDSGPYRWLRNPMALAGIAQGFAVGLWRDSPLVVLYATAGGFLWHTAARPPEERDLLARFGARYADYRRTVPLWLPRFGSRRGDGAVAAGLVLLTIVLVLGRGETGIARLAFVPALVLLVQQLLKPERWPR